MELMMWLKTWGGYSERASTSYAALVTFTPRLKKKNEKKTNKPRHLSSNHCGQEMTTLPDVGEQRDSSLVHASQTPPRTAW